MFGESPKKISFPRSRTRMSLIDGGDWVFAGKRQLGQDGKEIRSKREPAIPSMHIREFPKRFHTMNRDEYNTLNASLMAGATDSRFLAYEAKSVEFVGFGRKCTHQGMTSAFNPIVNDEIVMKISGCHKRLEPITRSDDEMRTLWRHGRESELQREAERFASMSNPINGLGGKDSLAHEIKMQANLRLKQVRRQHDRVPEENSVPGFSGLGNVKEERKNVHPLLAELRKMDNAVDCGTLKFTGVRKDIYTGKTGVGTYPNRNLGERTDGWMVYKESK